MEQTTLLNLPYIMPAQAQKHVTHNEALRILDAIVHIRVEGRDREEAPSDPAEGERWLVGGAPVGAFADQAGRIAAFQDGAWAFYEPQEGWVIWDAADGALLVFDGTDWTPVTETQNLPLIGVNATADATNRLAVAADATLLTHEGAGHQLKVNKAAAGDTGSLLFQTGWSGRAEMGLAGNDDFSIKVSPDGAAWHTALRLDRDTGAIEAEALGVGVSAPLLPLHVAGQSVFGDSINWTRIVSGTPGSNSPRAISLIDTGGAIRIWRRDTGINGPTLELVGGTASDNANAVGIVRWDATAIHSPERFAVRRRTGGATLEYLSIVNDGRIGVGTSTPSARLHVDGAVRVASYTVAALPSAASQGAGAIVFVADETGGAVLAFSDGTDWRRATDRAVVS